MAVARTGYGCFIILPLAATPPKSCKIPPELRGILPNFAQNENISVKTLAFERAV